MKLNKILFILLGVLAAVFLLYLLFCAFWNGTFTETRDIKYYSRAYSQISTEDVVKEVFPKAIPADATDITFSYVPPFLQGGEIFQLSYTTTDEHLTQWDQHLSNKADWIGSNQAWHAENSWSFDGTEAVRYQLYWDGSSNHGKMCYALIDKEANRITFYYSNW